MFYYVLGKNIIHKSPTSIPNPGFIFDKQIERAFDEDEHVVYEDGQIILLKKSKVYGDLSGESALEKKNAKLKEMIRQQDKYVETILNDHTTLTREREALFALKNK